MMRWSKERLEAEKRFHEADKINLNMMKRELMERAAGFKEFKERFADQWVRVEEGKKLIQEQEAMNGDDGSIKIAGRN